MTSPAQNFNEHTNLSEAEEALKEWGIKYTKNSVTGVITVPGNIDISGKKLKQLPDLSAVIVKGYFSCDHNHLTSLEGAPRYIVKSFYCEFNHLTSLMGGPEYVGGGFCCQNNKLINLVGSPPIVGENFWCRDNPLKDLFGITQNKRRYYTPFGEFTSWSQIPDSLKEDKAKKRLIAEAAAAPHIGLTRPLHTTRIKFIKKKPAP